MYKHYILYMFFEGFVYLIYIELFFIFGDDLISIREGKAWKRNI